MVFESIVSEIINKTLGQYLLNFDSENLKLGLWGGDVVLTNLELKPSALEELDLPIRCTFGYLGKLVLKIPWKDIYNSPCIAIIDSLYLLAVPNQQMKYDIEQEAKQAKETKEAELTKVEATKLKELEAGEEKPPANKTFTEKIVATVIKNIQVTIKNIHIRYEDRISNPGKPFALGITLDSLEVKSIPTWGEPLKIDPLNLVYKELSINWLCTYWNSKEAMYSLKYLDDKPEMRKVFQEGIGSGTCQPVNFKYILGPINAKASLRINMKPEQDGTNFAVPKFLLRLELEKLFVRLSKMQYQDLTCFLESLDMMSKAAIYRKYRPTVDSYKGHYKKWWLFAGSCIREQIKKSRKDWDWNNIRDYRLLLKSYATAYREKLMTPKPSKDFLAKCQALEDQLDVFMIILTRQRVEVEFTKEQLLRYHKGGNIEEKKGWMSSWFGGGKKDEAESSNIGAKFNAALTPEEKEKMFRAIGYTEGEVTTYPDFFVEVDMGAIVHEIIVEFIDEKLQHPTVMTISLQTGSLSVEQRPAIKGLKTDVSIYRFTIHGIEQNAITPKLVSSTYDSSTTPLLQILFEMNPLDKVVDQRVHLTAEPLSITYDAKTINSLLDVFQAETELPSTIQVAAQAKLEEFKQVSSLGLQHMLEQRSTLELNINIQASTVFIPQDGFHVIGNAVMMMSLGSIRVITQPRGKYIAKQMSHLTQEETAKEMIRHSYDNFQLKLENLQVIYSMKGENWATPKADMFFLKPTTLGIDFSKCIISNDPHLPKIKVKGQLPKVEISFTEARLKDCLSLFMSIPLPKSEEPQEDISQGRLSVSTKSLKLSRQHLDRPQLPPALQQQEEVVQFNEMECAFVLQELQLNIFVSEFDKTSQTLDSKEFLQFSLKHLETSLQKFSFNTEINLKLGSILFQHYFDNGWVNMMHTPTIINENNYLFMVKFTSVEKNSPELHTKYKSVLQLIEIDFTKLELLLHCEALRSIMVWAEDFQKVLGGETVEQAPPEKSFGSRLSIIAEGLSSDFKGTMASLNMASARTVRGKGMVRIDHVLLKLNAHLGEISVALWIHKKRLASLGIAGGVSELAMKKSYLTFELKLEGMYVNDHGIGTLYPKIVAIKDKEEVLTLKVVKFNDADRKVGSVDLSVKLSMARLQFVFLNSFVMSLLDFVNQFSAARDKIIDASQAAAEAAKQNVQNVYENAIRIGLDINLKAPIIVVPVNSKSYEAFTLDLGNIMANNSFLDVKVPNATDPAVLDRLKVTLENLKFSRVMFNKTLDNFIEEESIIEPISFKLTIQRNLSSGWFLDLPDLEVGGKLQAIKLSLSSLNYNLLMRALQENVGDTGHSQSAPLPPPTPAYDSKQTTSYSKKSTARTSTYVAKKMSQNEIKNVRTTMKFALTLESVIVELYTLDKKNAIKDSLAQFTLELISLKGSMMSDNSLHVAVILLDCILDDTRSSKTSKITRYMERKKDTDGDGDGKRTKSMVDITFQQKPGAIFADVRISSFILLLNVEHLEKISQFFAADKQSQETKLPSGRQTISAEQSKKTFVASEIPEEKSKLTLNFKCEHPDIVLVEHLHNLDTNAIVLDFEMIFSMRTADDKTVMQGSINELQLFSCSYNPEKRNETKSPILNPVTVILCGCEENGSMKIDIDATRIKLSVKPGTISLLSSISSALTSREKASVEEEQELIDRSKMWDVENFHDSDYYFLKTELAVEASETLEDQVLSATSTRAITPNVEICVVKFPEIIIVLEGGYGRATMPVLYVDSFFEVTASNWSSKLHLEGKFMIQTKYFNHHHAIWEPVIEPVPSLESTSLAYYNWTLNFTMDTYEEGDCDTSMGEDKMKKPLNSITIYSPDILNLTVTKKSLELFSSIGSMISDAIYKPETYAGEKAPYIVKNDSGISVKVLLDSEFVVFPPANDESAIKDILLDVNSSVGLSSSTQIEYLGLIDETKEKFIHIMIPTYNCGFHIPIMKAAKRFFPLNHRGPANDQWGIVSDVTVKNGQTIITLRGIIQVENTFNMPVSLYSMTNKENELHLIGTVEPKETINIPIDAIYTQTTELFFSVEGYTVSIVPYVWKDLQNCIQKTKVLRCNPKGQEQQVKGVPLFLRAIGELEQIYFENTNRHTILSTCFNISVRPTVIFKNSLPVDIIVCMEGIIDEEKLAPAESIQVPTAEPGISYIIIRIPNYLDREWSCKSLLEENPSDMAVWTFESYESSAPVKMELGIHVATVYETHVYSLYCPFWMINKTGLRLIYKQNDEGTSVLHHPADYNGIVMFSFRAKSFFAKKKCSLRIEDGQWSDKFSLDTAGSSGVVVCKLNNITYHVGVQIRILNNALTKEILFTPFHVFINHHHFPIEVREMGKESGPWQKILPNDCLPFWPTTKPDIGRLQARIEDTTETTESFPYYIAHNTVLKIKNKHGALNVDISLSDSGVFISFFAYEVGMAPILLINQTSHVIDVYDKAAKEATSVNLKPREQVLFTWGTFDDNHTLAFCKGKYYNDAVEDAIGNFIIDGEPLYWSTFLYGLQRVFLFTDSRSIATEAINLVDYEQVQQEIDLRLHGIGLSLVDDAKKNEILYISLSGSDIVWESRKPGKKHFKRFSHRDIQLIESAYQDYIEVLNIDRPSHVVKTERMTLDFKNMKLLHPSEKEIRRKYIEGVWTNLKISSNLTRIHLKINHLQIDQQMWDCIFPVIFAPVPPPKSVMAEQASKPFVEVSILKMINQYSHVQQFKYLGILVQEFHVRVDSGILASLLGFFESQESSEADEVKAMDLDLKRPEEVLYYFVTISKGQEEKNYYGKLHLSPLKIHLSFSLSSGGESGAEEEKSHLPPVVDLFLRSFGVTLTDINDVVFKINFFERESVLTTQSQLMKEVTGHYTAQILQQLYVLVFGLDVIGNPFGLLVGFKQGATDLFYEPIQGAIQGPGEFAEGLVLGVRSLVGHTVGGAAGAISKMTGAVGKGLAALTFDDEYQRQRREHQRMKPTNMQEGLARSGKGLVMGVVEGIGGVVTKPISGAKQEGVTGFFKGVGKGMVGLVTRPTAGFVDFASGSLGAVRRATEVGHDVTRKRIPRYIRPDGLVRPYSPPEAEGNKHLQELDKGKYSKTDEYIFHMSIGYAVKNKDVLLLTDNRILYLGYNEIFGGYQLEWSHKWSEIIKDPELTNDGVRFWTAKQKSLKTMFSGGDTGKVLLVDHFETRKKLVELMRDHIHKESMPSPTTSITASRLGSKSEASATKQNK